MGKVGLDNLFKDVKFIDEVWRELSRCLTMLKPNNMRSLGYMIPEVELRNDNEKLYFPIGVSEGEEFALIENSYDSIRLCFRFETNEFDLNLMLEHILQAMQRSINNNYNEIVVTDMHQETPVDNSQIGLCEYLITRKSSRADLAILRRKMIRSKPVPSYHLTLLYTYSMLSEFSCLTIVEQSKQILRDIIDSIDNLAYETLHECYEIANSYCVELVEIFS